MIHSNPTHNTTDGRTQNEIRYEQVTNKLDSMYRLAYVRKKNDNGIVDKLLVWSVDLLIVLIIVVLFTIAYS